MVKLKRIFILIAVISFIQFSHPLATDAAAKYPEGSTIATISVANNTIEETKTRLETEVAIWKDGEDLELTSALQTFYIPRSAFEFDIDATLNHLNERTKRTWSSFFMRPKNVHVPLVVQLDEQHEAVTSLQGLNYIDADATLAQAIDVASELSNDEIPITYIDETKIPLETIHEIEKDIPENLSSAVMAYAVKEINEYTIGSEETFSFLEAVTFPGDLNNSSKELSFIATVLYELLLHTNVELIEKNSPMTVPDYSEAGIAVAIDRQQEKDLIVLNPNHYPFKISAKKNGEQLVMSLETISIEKSYGYEVKQVEEIEPRTLYRYSTKLNIGESDLIQEGKKGEKVTVDRLTYSESNTIMDRETIREEVYLPVPRIVAVSAKKLDANFSEGSESGGGDSSEWVELEDGEWSDVDDSEWDELDEIIDEDIESDRQEMNDLVDQLDDLIIEGEFDEEDDVMLSTLLLLGFLVELENFKNQLEEFDERLAQIENTEISNDDTDFLEYQKEIDERMSELAEQYERILEMILHGEGAD